MLQSDNVLGDLLLLAAIFLLGVQIVSLVWGIWLLRAVGPGRPGYELLRILVTVSGVNVVAQGLNLWRAVLLVVAPESSLFLRTANFLLVEVVTAAVMVWSIWRSSRLASDPGNHDLSLRPGSLGLVAPEDPDIDDPGGQGGEALEGIAVEVDQPPAAAGAPVD